MITRGFLGNGQLGVMSDWPPQMDTPRGSRGLTASGEIAVICWERGNRLLHCVEKGASVRTYKNTCIPSFI